MLKGCWEEDANIELAKEARKRNHKAQSRYSRKRFFSAGLYKCPPPLFSLAPEPRPFRWLIESTHYAEGYGTTATMKNASPWVLRFRCLLVDLPALVEDGSTIAWRGYAASSRTSTEAVACFRHGSACIPFHCKCDCGHGTWGRRVVFSEQDRGDARVQAGSWLVVAYIWADDRQWVEEVDVGSMLSLDKGNAEIHCFHLRALQDGRKATWNCFFEGGLNSSEGVWMEGKKMRRFPMDEAKKQGVALGRIVSETLKQIYTGASGDVDVGEEPEVKRAMVEMLKS
ncbi:hypothetical protein B0T22DRAFT_510243 [Podospora appendiculata]|uniref:Uncharacterized protein n=1 Tax=Podospora appendiculata TaxID=314037 RepID=A0AAE1CBJ7_9PEZI|nr:hypothetical protein B0T22DRAFT_510243 [Podospora appendiculata]